MHPVVIAVVLAGIVALATAVGLFYRHLQGRARLGDGSEVVQIEGLRLGEQATLLQFSTAFCAPCVSTARVLDAVADAHEGTAHVVIDVTDRPELATRFNLLQTPTTLVLDSGGHLHARLGGAVRHGEVIRALGLALVGNR